MNKIKIGTFFSGIGSPEQAMINLGVDHDVKFACEIDKFARETYLKNFSPDYMYEDVTKLDMKKAPAVDLLVFGFPCQAFSMAGRRGGFDDTRGTLFYDALRYLREHKPRYFIGENVKGLLSHDNGKTFRTIIDCVAKTENNQYSIMPFDNLGYNIHYQVLNTKNFGVPQNRERIFIVGIRDDEDNDFRFPSPMPLKVKLKDILEKVVEEKFFLSQRMVDGIYKSKFMERKPMKIDGICKTLKVGGDTPCFKDDRVISHSLYPRTSKTGKGGTGRLQKEDGTSYCLDTGNAQAVEVMCCLTEATGNRAGSSSEFLSSVNRIHKNTGHIRRLTPIEAERLQGFPDNFTSGVSDTQRYKQLGNTITVNVIQAVINNLLK